jgi:Peptidase family M41
VSSVGINRILVIRSDSMTKKRVLSIAYHEAGHAVAARLVKPPVMVKYVTIIPDEHNLGHCASRKLKRLGDGSSWFYLLVYFFLSRFCLSTELHWSFGVSETNL